MPPGQAAVVLQYLSYQTEPNRTCGHWWRSRDWHAADWTTALRLRCQLHALAIVLLAWLLRAA